LEVVTNGCGEPILLFSDFIAENVYHWCSRFSFKTSLNEIFQIIMVNSTNCEIISNSFFSLFLSLRDKVGCAAGDYELLMVEFASKCS
jgi:hypothetical protein